MWAGGHSIESEFDFGCPSIRTKALSSDTAPWQCFSHRVFAREVEDRSSGNLTVNHFFHAPSTTLIIIIPTSGYPILIALNASDRASNVYSVANVEATNPPDRSGLLTSYHEDHCPRVDKHSSLIYC